MKKILLVTLKKTCDEISHLKLIHFIKKKESNISRKKKNIRCFYIFNNSFFFSSSHFPFYCTSNGTKRIMTATKTDIQRLIECCICCDYLTEVRETPCCHQLFCYTCIQSWLAKPTKVCPRCRSNTLTEQSLLKNIVIQRFVDNLQFDCPNALKGCSVKVPRCDLIKHKRLCSYSSEKLAQKHRSKLEESRNLLIKYKEGKMHLTENILLDLAKLFSTEHEYDHAKECLQMIKEKNNSQEILILQAQIERDTNQYDKALELYTKAYSLANSISQRIELLTSKGHLLLKKAQYEQAKDTFTQALDLLKYDDSSQTKAEILNSLGLIAKKCSDVKKKKSYLIFD